MSVLMRAAAGLDTGSAPITFVASSSTNNAGSFTTIVINKPTGTADGDLMVAFIGLGGGTTVTPPAGWSVATSDGTSTSVDPFVVFYKLASSEGSNYTFTLAATRYASGSILSYRNAKMGFAGPLSTNSTTCVAPEVNLPTSGCLLFACYSESNNGATFSTPAGMSTVVSETDGTAPNYAIFSQSGLSTGLTGTRTSTISSAGNGLLLFVTPSSYVPPTPQFIASASTQNTSSGATLVINKPTGTQDGDLMIAFMGTDSAAGSPTWTGDTGWAEVADMGAGGASPRIAYKVASSEGSSYTFTLSNSNSKLAGSILTYRGASYDAIGSFTSGATPLAPTGPSAAANYCLLVGFAIGPTGSRTWTSSMTSRVTDSDGTAPSYGIFDEPVGYGATGTRSFSGGSGTTNAAILLTIKPA